MVDRKQKQQTANSTYPKGGGSCSKDSFVVNQTLVFQIKFCGKSPALRVAAERYKLCCSINIHDKIRSTIRILIYYFNIHR
jgi:hypothetical protein